MEFGLNWLSICNTKKKRLYAVCTLNDTVHRAWRIQRKKSNFISSYRHNLSDIDRITKELRKLANI